MFQFNSLLSRQFLAFLFLFVPFAANTQIISYIYYTFSSTTCAQTSQPFGNC